MKVDFTLKKTYKIEDLVQIMTVLRSENGCPWDRAQTHQSIRKNFIEETYEVAEAIDRADAALLREELGDVLLQVVFHAQMEKERGVFDFDDVCNDICQKLIIRHPHIFADVVAETPAEVLSNWEDIKKREKGQKTASDTLRGVSPALPALMRSAKVQHRAAKTGFDYPDVEGALGDLASEVDELGRAIAGESAQRQAEELGDVLFAAVNVSRFIGADAEESLSRSCERFIGRFEEVERIAAERGMVIKDSSIEELNALWHEAKQRQE